ncbi:hypothetical protein KFK14_13940 [Sphingobium phenoxybenzoativorans]|uniref:Calcium-binding protein n=1 Tax=Sphingobium phenoxybenzoativorans TaxID=1592790 RepID=A0A975Q451_9SPHN|nr:hypothetical protein KFK14_13940 [Sphingobium phenoxybenzoativorans]
MLTGDGGANTLNGGNGDDVLTGGAGADSLIGGNGTDTASYSNAGSAVVANLANSAANTADAAGDTYNGVENLLGTDYADTLTGDSGANRLDGGNGDDILRGGAGADTLVGGSGIDTADYSGSGAINLNLSTATGTGTGGDAQGDTLSGIEHILGSGNNDSFTLNLSAGWSVDGGAGQDTVTMAANSGTVNQAALLGVLSNVERIDFTASNVTANLTVDSSFIQSIVGAGNSSHLTLAKDGADTITIDPAAHYSVSGSDYTFYSDAGMTTQVAQLTIA